MQEFYDWVLTGFSAILGFLLNAVWQAVKDLQKTDMELTKRVSEVEVLVAGKYVTRDEFNGHMGELFRKLEIISEKIDRKADK